MSPRQRVAQNLGLLAALLSAATFATSGPFAKAMQAAGWSSGATVLLRVGGASLVLLPSTIWTLRGRWYLVRANLRAIAAYGAVAVAGCQVAYFYALQHLDVGVALLMEYTGILLIVAVVAIRRRALPPRLTSLGIAVSLAGLVFVLDITGQSRPSPIGLFWGFLAAIGLATYFLVASQESALPPIALAGLGMGFGAVVLAVLGLARVLPMAFATTDISLGGHRLPWWFGIGELALVAAAAAYVLGIEAARRLGSTVASFVGLTEVLFAIGLAWLLLGELPGLVQLIGGAVLLVGVVTVKLGEARAGEPPVEVEPVPDPEPALVAARP
ncbi:MAG: DMT family transporter [Nostocoides sp.]